MEPIIIDAFTDVPLGGNPAGVVILDGDYPPDAEMLALAAKLGFSETAFVRVLGGDTIRLRYFTPVEEVPLCGHATIASFEGLLRGGYITEGRSYVGKTGSGDINVDVSDGLVWMDTAPPKELGPLAGEDRAALYAMYGLSLEDKGELEPAIVDSGLPDIMMPVRSRDVLAGLKPDFGAISDLSKKLRVTGVHVFTPGDDIAAYCRNFAPLYAIDEEAATGTSNGALTFYLYNRGLVQPGALNCFIQGEAMGKPSRVWSKLLKQGDKVVIRVGGRGIIRP